jgi:recombination protein RecR
MYGLPRRVQDLIDELSRLPGIGPKSAERLAFYLLRSDPARREKLGTSISLLREGIVACERCCNLAEATPCELCSDPSRDQETLLVVEEPLDLVAIEKSGYRGLYHVLGGAISPVEGIGPDQLFMNELFRRLEREAIAELILATNPNLEGEATAMYIARELAGCEFRISRLAHGLPMGADLEYADQVTLSRALEGRRSFSAS